MQMPHAEKEQRLRRDLNPRSEPSQALTVEPSDHPSHQNIPILYGNYILQHTHLLQSKLIICKLFKVHPAIIFYTDDVRTVTFHTVSVNKVVSVEQLHR